MSTPKAREGALVAATAAFGLSGKGTVVLVVVVGVGSTTGGRVVSVTGGRVVAVGVGGAGGAAGTSVVGTPGTVVVDVGTSQSRVQAAIIWLVDGRLLPSLTKNRLVTPRVKTVRAAIAARPAYLYIRS